MRAFVIAAALLAFVVAVFQFGPDLYWRARGELNENSSIFEAAGVGSYRRVKKLLRDDPKIVAARDQSGFTPLFWAAIYDQIKVAELLLSRGADVNARDKNGLTALYQVAAQGHKAMAELLLRHGADVNAKDIVNGGGRTPLHAAASSFRAECVQLLLDKGANVNAQDNWGGSPLNEAAFDGQPWLFPVGGGKALSDDEARRVREKTIRTLLDKGADIRLKDNRGWTPLASAAFNGKDYIAEMILAKGAEPDIFVAAALGKAEVITKLLGRDPQSLNATDDWGFPIFSWN